MRSRNLGIACTEENPNRLDTARIRGADRSRQASFNAYRMEDDTTKVSFSEYRMEDETTKEGIAERWVRQYVKFQCNSTISVSKSAEINKKTILFVKITGFIAGLTKCHFTLCYFDFNFNFIFGEPTLAFYLQIVATAMQNEVLEFEIYKK